MTIEENKEEENPILQWTNEIDILLATWCDNAK
jgi:hypothetical protein